MKFIYTVLFFILLSSSLRSDAQTAASGNAQKGRKTLVSLPVTVSDRDGRYLTGLKKSDFVLYQDGVEQSISSFSTFEEPVNIALLLDTSGSTRESLNKIKDAAADFIELLEPQDKCLISTFDSQIKMLSPLTADHKTLKSSLNQITTADKEGTLFFDAVEQAAQKSFAGVEGRKVIIVLSDGKDFGSSLSKKELLSRLDESDVAIYSIFYESGGGFNKMAVEPDGTLKEAKAKKAPKPKKPKKQKKNYSILIPLGGDVYTEEEVKLSARAADVEAVSTLKEITDTTAGRFYQSDTPNLDSIFKKIAGELRQLYRLGYYSTDAGEGQAAHQIIIKVNRPDAVVRSGGKFRAAQL